MKKINKIYVAGALTVVNDVNIKAIYEEISDLCEEYCGNIYAPHLNGTDPVMNPQVPPQTVWKKDLYEIVASNLMIAYVGQPSLGVGAELEIARITATDVILWWFKGEKVSRMARGNPAIIHEFEVETKEELFEKIKEFLKKWEPLHLTT